MKTWGLMAGVLGMWIGMAAVAAEPLMADPVTAAFNAKLQQLYPKTTFQSVKKSLLPGVYEVVFGPNTAYVDESGRYFLFGHLFDMKEQRDLTENREKPTVKIDFSALPVKDAIVTVKGTGERKLAVFSDPDCPYCRQLESTLAEVDNVTIYTFMYPLDGLHPDAKRKAISVWCAGDRGKAWHALMAQGTVPSEQCNEHPVDRNIGLAQSLNINATPSLVFASGNLVSGVPRRENLEQMLGSGK